MYFQADSSALVLNNLKVRLHRRNLESPAYLTIPQKKNPSNYWAIIDAAFNPSPSSSGAGLSYIRVPVGATDFSANGEVFD